MALEYLSVRSDPRPILGTSPPLDAWSGAGVYQRQLLRRLSDSFVVEEMTTTGRTLPMVPFADRLLRALRALRRPNPCEVFLVSATPMPLGLRSTPVVAVVFDVRWIREGGPIHRTYRWIDLRRLGRRASRFIVISERTRRELLSQLPQVHEAVHVIHPGPGQFDKLLFVDRHFRGKVLLMGSSPHKRNDLAARAIVDARPSWCTGVVGVNVGPAVKRHLEGTWLGTTSTWLERPDEARLVQTLQEVAVFVNLSLEEGFGFPYIEALSAGCHVIAADCDLTQEIIGAAGWLLPADTLANVTSALKGPPVVRPRHVRQECARAYSWERCGEEVTDVLRTVLSQS